MGQLDSTYTLSPTEGIVVEVGHDLVSAGIEPALHASCPRRRLARTFPSTRSSSKRTSSRSSSSRSGGGAGVVEFCCILCFDASETFPSFRATLVVRPMRSSSGSSVASFNARAAAFSAALLAAALHGLAFVDPAAVVDVDDPAPHAHTHPPTPRKLHERDGVEQAAQREAALPAQERGGEGRRAVHAGGRGVARRAARAQHGGHALEDALGGHAWVGWLAGSDSER
jgi:hypothetical protein